MEIKIEDHLSQEELKDICISEVRKYVRNTLTEKKDIERIISNSAYSVVWEAVDSVFDGGVQETLKDKVVSLVKGLKVFNIFDKPDPWNSDSNNAYKALEGIVLDNKPLMNERVKEILNGLDEAYLNGLFEENFTDIILNKLQSGAEK